MYSPYYINMVKIGKGKWNIPRSRLGQFLRQKRLERGISAYELALTLGVSEYVIYCAESTKIPSERNLKKLCLFYNLDIEEVRKTYINRKD